MKTTQRFEIDSDGFAANQAYREPWTLVRELIANAFDEKITQCCVELKAAGPSQRGVWITVEDDGPGFGNPSDIYTLYGPTPKKGDPKTRGRWNSGEKEFLSIAREATVETTNCSVHFGKGRVVRKKGISQGTRIKALLPWTAKDLSDTARMLRRFIPPDKVEYTVAVIRGKQNETYRVPVPELVTSAQATLPTVLDKGEGLRPTKRKTTLKVYRPIDVERSAAAEPPVINAE